MACWERLKLFFAVVVVGRGEGTCPASARPRQQVEIKCGACSDSGDDGGTTKLEVTVAAGLSRELPRQLVLVKVPETGSSTAANLLAEVARRKAIPYWLMESQGDCERIVERSPLTAAKWSLGHRSFGAWVNDFFEKKTRALVTTTRIPSDRLSSSALKVLQGPECSGDMASSKNKYNPSPSSSSSSDSDVCRHVCHHGVATALNFWGVEAKLIAKFKAASDGGRKAAREVVDRFDSIWVMERYNESLVLFALKNRLQLWELLPPLSKYHAVPSAPAEEAIRRTCLDTAAEATATKFEAAIHDAAVERLDKAAFAAHLDIIMSGGNYGSAKTLAAKGKPNPTLHTDDCLRRCVAQQLSDRVRIIYAS